MTDKPSKSVIQSFSAAYSGKPSVLVLGSIPGVASLEAVQYYAHPRNAFWRIMATYFGFELSLPYEERLTCLSQQGIALWDVLQQCEREGSLDSAIQKNTIQLNPILEFVQALGSVKLVLLNGGKAATEFNKHFQKQIETEEGIRAMVMPSTSPAYAAMPIEEKQLKWHQALDSVFKT